MKEQTLRLPGNSVLKCGLLLGILLLAHAPSTAHGQQLTAGDSIRVRASRSTEPERQLPVQQPQRWTAVEQPKSRWIEATVVRVTPDTLWYESNGNVSPISMHNVNIERPTFGNHQKAGLAIGFIAGGAVGAVIAYRAFEPTFGYSGGFGAIGASIAASIRGSKLPQSNSRAGDTAAGAVGGAAFGGLLGFFVGPRAGSHTSACGPATPHRRSSSTRRSDRRPARSSPAPTRRPVPASRG